jgi:hypothetical protein
MAAAAKSTYSLDPASLERLTRLSQRWQVSKTETIRRALAKAEEADQPTPEQRLAALHSLQKSLKDRGVDFDAWGQTIRDARR